jgi:hypothetical protein
MNKEAVSADHEQNDRPKAAGLAAAFAGDSLLEDSAAEIGVPSPGSHRNRGFKQRIIAQSCFARESHKLLCAEDTHPIADLEER